ncbi:hypothetical protein Tco_0856692 [Tanacetum coccineum]|uniref:GAG-pre-integrase domain-containing protein n=1 Tax=Tanacetum coccineum TaxID=301880 RepID=A0ABQ5B470_9ASTR
MILLLEVFMAIWQIIDSCAKQHLTVSTGGMFDVVDRTSLKITGGHPNGTLATISHIGNLKLSNNVVLYDILVVLGYCVNLKKEKVLGTGSESGGSYMFNINNVNSVGKYNMIMCFNVSKLLWHNKNGHPADQVLGVMQSDLNITKSRFVPVCEVCHRAKHTRDPFPLFDHKSKGLGMFFTQGIPNPQSSNDEGKASSVKDGIGLSFTIDTIDTTDVLSLYGLEAVAMGIKCRIWLIAGFFE